jgi:hypothetical protein
MPRKSHLFTSAATVLACVLVLAATLPNGRDGLAVAGEAPRLGDQHGKDDVDPRSLVQAGRLVSVTDVNVASCRPGPAAALDAAAIDAALKGQVVHLARVAAELQGLEDVVLPEALQNRQNDGAVAAALHDERQAFAARREALASQTASLNQAKELGEREVEFTKAKEAALARQGALLQKELDNINALMNKGLAVTSQRLALEQSVLQSETNRLDLKLMTLKAQQEVGKIERSIMDLLNQWRNEAVVEFNKTQATLAALSQQAQAAASAASGADAAAHRHAGGDCDDMRERLYVIVRGPDGVLQAFPVAAKQDARGEASAVLAQNRP